LGLPFPLSFLLFIYSFIHYPIYTIDMPSTFLRKNIRLPHRSYLGRSLCFATLWFAQRRRAHASDALIANWLISSLRTYGSRASLPIHAYRLMPDHLHFLAEGTQSTSDVLCFVGTFKQQTSYAFSQRTGRRLWQPKWYDHLLRANDSVEAVCWYIWLNPVRQRICWRPTEYPFHGSFSDCASRLAESAPDSTWLPPWKLPG
jgi:putative transposase